MNITILCLVCILLLLTIVMLIASKNYLKVWFLEMLISLAMLIIVLLDAKNNKENFTECEAKRATYAINHNIY